ncbi:TraM recognition domain-containing protein [Aliarcobacter cryaerophilus]|uniref:TraM recognition domain-containing protein n=1 Tax=Aliarcobacter cryaerophilus TaxID=28198 RepID=UPI0021B1BED3|nr:type IV secretory system conjugative DNA transfer family protein [Aliarcobacter cryaerophilus]MCT7464606.1 TraM recognition domain-containing protein [Aliarcobacter cryaerophilus]MCT7464829.1 TraM recognition domain-containing protein [Aliarcobacter cryaerophilus]
MEIGFNKKEMLASKNLVIDHDFTNGIIFGRTGSGKTTCAILPNIEDRIKNDFGIIVYDFKGNLHLQVKYIANKYKKLDQVIEIGKPWGVKVNLFDYLNIDTLSYIVNETDTIDSYWNDAARSLFATVARIHKDMNYFFYELRDLFKYDYLNNLEKEFIKKLSYFQISKYVNSLEDIKQFIENSLEAIRVIEYKIGTIDKNKELKSTYDVFKKSYEVRCIKLKQLLETLKYYTNVKNDSRDTGRVAVLNHLNSILMNVASKDYLNVSQIDVVEELRNGKIVIIDVSSLNFNCMNVLNLAIYSKLQRGLYNVMKPVTIFIDEAQKVLHKDYLPQVDVCRESRFEYILATQDEKLLKTKLGTNKFEELYANIVSKYSFATNSNDINNKFEYIDLNTNRKAMANPMFLDKKDLIKVEHEFQKASLVLAHSDYLADEDEIYILKYDETLIEDYKVVIQTIDDDVIECKYISHPNKYLFMKKYNIKKVDYMYLFEESINFEVEEELEEDCG